MAHFKNVGNTSFVFGSACRGRRVQVAVDLEINLGLVFQGLDILTNQLELGLRFES